MSNPGAPHGIAGARLDPGPGTAIVGPGLVVLLDAPHHHEVTQLLAAPALNGSDLLGLMSRLSGMDLATLPSFGCASAEAGGCRLLLRGSITAEVTRADGTVDHHDAEGRSTWSELHLDDVRSVTLRGPGAVDRASFGLISGLAAAGSVSFDLAPVTIVGPAVRPPKNEPEPAATPSPPAASEPPTPMAPTPGSDGPDLDYEHLFEGTVYRAAAPAEADVDSDGATTDTAPAPAPDPTSPLTTVFDETDDVGPPPSTTAPSIAHDPSPPVTPPVAVAPASPSPSPSPGGLIDWVPGSVPAPTSAPEPPTGEPAPSPDRTPSIQPSEPEDDGLDSATVTVASLRAGSATAPTGPQVTAVRCPAGHPNPVHADACRRCQTPIVDRTVLRVTRPSLGRLRFEDGSTVELDRHVVLGRNPSADLLVKGEPTRAITLASAENALSRTHAIVQLDDWQVQVIDRDSMNHTYVEVPGRPAFQLRPSEPYPVPAGSIVRLGEEVAFTYETSAP